MAVTALERAPKLPASKPAPAAPALRWGALEAFLGVLYLSSALLFIPGTQAVRGVIRGLPYAVSLGFLIRWYVRSGGRPRRWPGQAWLAVALGAMALGLLHPEANFFAGLGQIFFQLSIVGPFLWVGGESIDPPRLRRLLMLIFLASAASAFAGLLQFFYPDRFMPPEFSGALSEVKGYMEMLAFKDASGRTIIRPPGLTDLPGGAASGSAVTAMLGLLMAARPGTSLVRRLALIALAGLGLITLYLTFVRSLLMGLVLVIGGVCLLLARQGRLKQCLLLVGIGGGLVLASFSLAVTLGGDAVFNRFFGVIETGVGESFHSNRGIFLEHTFTDLIFDYPLGGGVGRWGMMTQYFGRLDANPSPPLYVEIQVTGWLFDGGIPLLLGYAAAILFSSLGLYRLASSARGGAVAYPALIALSVNVFTLLQATAGPTFNTTGGMQFWLVAAIVFRAADRLRADRPHPPLLPKAP